MIRNERTQRKHQKLLDRQRKRDERHENRSVKKKNKRKVPITKLVFWRGGGYLHDCVYGFVYAVRILSILLIRTRRLTFLRTVAIRI